MGTRDPGDNGGGYGAEKVLRLTFHDCLKYDDGTGGCDGCLNWEGMGTEYEEVFNFSIEKLMMMLTLMMMMVLW